MKLKARVIVVSFKAHSVQPTSKIPRLERNKTVKYVGAWNVHTIEV